MQNMAAILKYIAAILASEMSYRLYEWLNMIDCKYKTI